jgi:hypothetical protein
MRSVDDASVPVEKAVSAVFTFAASDTSALASMPSSFVPSAATSRPSTVPLAAIFPVTLMPVLVVASLVALLYLSSTSPFAINCAVTSSVAEL